MGNHSKLLACNKSIRALLSDVILRKEATKRGGGEHPSPELFRNVALEVAEAIEEHFNVHFYQVRFLSEKEIALIICVSRRSPIYLLYNFDSDKYYPYSVGRIVSGRKLSDKMFVEFGRYICLRQALVNMMAPSTAGDYTNKIRRYNFTFI